MKRNLSIEVKENTGLLCHFFTLTMSYESECWTKYAQMEAKLKAVEMWLYRKMFWKTYKEQEF